MSARGLGLAGLALLLLAPLGASEPSWPGGTLSLGEACALLVAAGHPTSLAPELDPAQRAELPLIAGGYWAAVLAISEAFDCQIAPPERAQRYRDRRDLAPGLAVDLDGGPVLLEPASGPRARLSAQGPLLLELLDAGVALRRSDRSGVEQARAALLLRLRLAPGHPLAELGPAVLEIHRLESGEGSPLAWEPPERPETGQLLPLRLESGRSTEPLLLLLPEVDRWLRSISLEATLRVALLRRVELERELRAGDRLPVALDEGASAELWLSRAEQVADSPWHRPGLGLGLPPGVELGCAPSVTVSSLDGRPLRDFGSRSLGGERLVHYTYLHQLGEGPYRAKLELDLVAARLVLPLALDLHLP